MFVSIIIPAYGKEALLKDCILHLRRAAMDNYEIIVVDDGTNPPLDVADPQTQLLRSPDNLGAAAARNLGASVARGDVLLFVDSDIMMLEPAYRRIIDFFQEHPRAVVQGVYSPEVPYDNFCSRYKAAYWSFNQSRFDPISFGVRTAIFAIRKDLFAEIGGFNPRSRVGEDKEFGLFLKEKQVAVFQDSRIQGTHHHPFDFLGLLSHHFQNAVNCALLLLRTRAQGSTTQGARWVARKQVIGMFLLPLAFASLALHSIAAVAGALLLCVVYLSHDFLVYAWRRHGFKFAALATFIYLLEDLVAAAGATIGVCRYFLLGRRDLDFIFEAKR